LKKQLIFIIFLFCLLAPATVTFLWLKKQKKEVKHEVKWKIIQGLDKSELVLIQLNKTEIEDKLEWEHSKEFEFEGEMYDVVEFEETTDSIKYWCWWDHKETKLNKNLADVVNSLLGNHPERQEKERQLISFYQSLFLEKVFHWRSTQFISISNPVFFYRFNLKKYIKNIPTPPPQLIR